jgi:hypothetical protein
LTRQPLVFLSVKNLTDFISLGNCRVFDVYGKQETVSVARAHLETAFFCFPYDSRASLFGSAILDNASPSLYPAVLLAREVVSLAEEGSNPRVFWGKPDVSKRQSLFHRIQNVLRIHGYAFETHYYQQSKPGEEFFPYVLQPLMKTA